MSSIKTALVRPIHSMTKLARLLAIALPTLSVASQTQAQDKQWYFDIELIVYKRDIAPSEVSEQFEPGLRQVSGDNRFDLLMPIVQPDLNDIRQHLDDCEVPEQTPDIPSLPEMLDPASFKLEPWEPLSEETDPTLQSDNDQQTSADPASEMAQQGSLQENERAIADTDVDYNDSQPSQETANTLPQNDEADLATQLDGAVSRAIGPSNPDPVDMLPDYLTLPNWQPISFYPRFDCAIAPRESRQVIAKQVPIKPTAKPNPYSTDPQLLAADDLQLQDLAHSLSRQRGLTLMLHTAWRQQVFFGRENGQALHLFAGQNFAFDYDVDGKRIKQEESSALHDSSSLGGDVETGLDVFQPLSGTQFEAEDNLIEKIRQALNSDEAVDQSASEPLSESIEQQIQDYLWELDGSLQVFLRYINRTPYLHIDGNLDFRAPIIDQQASQTELDTIETRIPNQPSRIQSFGFTQLRRVISTQVHYFDHPMFGMVVQIRRYDMPELSEPEEQQ